MHGGAAFEIEVFNYELCSNELYIFREDNFDTCMLKSQILKQIRYNLSKL